MAKVLVEETNLTNIGNAIRGQNRSTTKYKPGEMADAISAIETEPTLQSKTVSPSTSSQTVKPDSGYDGLSQVTVNAMATATQATPSITVSSGGLITASATQTAGYVSAGTKSATKQLTTKAATTWTPKTTDQTIASGTYLTGTQTIKGDSNLVASNIKSGISIFGVAGSVVEGITPSGELAITENGTFDVTNYASALVNVASSDSETQVAMGTYRVASAATSTNTKIVEVTDLSFTPSTIAIIYASPSTFSGTSYRYVLAELYQNGTTNVRGVYMITSSMGMGFSDSSDYYGKITPTSNGFTVHNGSKPGVHGSGVCTYIAIS